MNRDALLTVALALCCVFAISTAATTLQSAVSTKPSEAIDVDYGSLPIDSDDAEELRRRVEGDTRSAESGSRPVGSSGDASASASGGDGPKHPSQKRADRAERSDRQASKSTDSPGSHQSQQHKRKQKQKQSGGEESGSNPPEETLLDRLEELLATLVALLGRAAPFALAIVALAVLVRYRRRVLSRLRSFGPPPRAQADGGRPMGTAVPENDVVDAWFEMVAGLGLDRDPTRTPGQCAQRAVDAGLDPEAVARLTEAFEAVRYGDEPPTDERITQARDAIGRLRDQGFGGGEA